jgi:hypothetical protein
MAGPGSRRRAAITAPGPDRTPGLAARLQTAMTLLPPVLGGAPTQPLEVGRSSRVVQAAQPAALAVPDGGWVFPGCHRPWPGARPTTGRSTRAAGG